MFGTNSIARVRTLDTYAVQEVFYTIQGEGPLVGLPSVFVRLSGCNLRCYFCDTDFESSKLEVELDELCNDIEAKRGKAQWVVITGGEPMLQKLGPLVFEIVRRLGMSVQIETAGSVWPASFNDPNIDSIFADGSLMIVCSPKTGRVVPEVLERTHDWKYIISADDELHPFDGLPVASTQHPNVRNAVQRPELTDPLNRIWVQPCEHNHVAFEWDRELSKSRMTSSTRDNERSARALKKAVDVCLQYGYRLSVQVHKIAGVA